MSTTVRRTASLASLMSRTVTLTSGRAASGLALRGVTPPHAAIVRRATRWSRRPIARVILQGGFRAPPSDFDRLAADGWGLTPPSVAGLPHRSLHLGRG